MVVADNSEDPHSGGRVVRWRAGGVAREVVAGNGQGDGLDQLDTPTGIAVERDGAVLVADYGNH